MNRVLAAAAVAAAFGLSGCAVMSGNLAMPSSNAPSVVTSQRLSETTFTVTVVGEFDTSQFVINDALMRQAAERTLSFGYDLFTTRSYPTADSADLLASYKPHGTLLVEMSKGAKPAESASIYDAREVSQRLGRPLPAG
ncbi:hypothetical protein [Caulobacter sp. 17J65-9]|uniref:hypothetical protein n=1 Tax=Caulobacter sp. 17J65-9 TaxID=2709382 RepID=UPI0013C96D70|nr:hypothetical protein [Caulobacter sp. 17J65-9]NEX94792.1 hypothetical protein [Caulobacter sp. 17J65-9]